MKYIFATALIAIGASTVQAAAEASPANEVAARWCRFRGQPCWKVKRAAEAFATALQEDGPHNQAREAEALYSNDEGNAAFAAKRQVDDLALSIAASQDAPVDWYPNLNLEDYFPVDTNKTEKRWCRFRGQPCWKAKRDAEASEVDKRMCGKFRGQPCWKAKRDTDEAAEVAHEELVQNDKRWCKFRGQPCWKAKRAAEALLESVDANAVEKRGEIVDKRPIDERPVAKRWCGKFRGQPCWKREAEASPEAACYGADGECTKAARDIDAMIKVARNIVEAQQ